MDPIAHDRALFVRALLAKTIQTIESNLSRVARVGAAVV